MFDLEEEQSVCEDPAAEEGIQHKDEQIQSLQY
jgi:hypothetical protein